MRILLVGASGAIGTRLIPQLTDRGHEVIGTFRSPEHAERIRVLSAQAIALDALDPSAVRHAVLKTQPEAIINQATALADMGFARNLDRAFAPTNRLRVEGTNILLAAAREAGVRRFVAQSFAPYRYIREGGMIKTEDDPLDPNPPSVMRKTTAAMNHLDQVVIEAGGIALRYGGFYGAPDMMTEAVRKRRYPMIGPGMGIMPFIHLEDAARATALAVEHDGPAIYNIVDDDPAPMCEWLPGLAAALASKPPRRVPSWVARLIVGEGMLNMSAESRGASNGKAKRELGWTLRYPSWRQGFSAAYNKTGPSPVESATSEA